MRGMMHLALGFFLLQITLVAAKGWTSPRLVEKELEVDLPSDNNYLKSGLEKPLRLSGYFKVGTRSFVCIKPVGSPHDAQLN